MQSLESALQQAGVKPCSASRAAGSGAATSGWGCPGSPGQPGEQREPRAAALMKAAGSGRAPRGRGKDRGPEERKGEGSPGCCGARRPPLCPGGHPHTMISLLLPAPPPLSFPPQPQLIFSPLSWAYEPKALGQPNVPPSPSPQWPRANRSCPHRAATSN